MANESIFNENAEPIAVEKPGEAWLSFRVPQNREVMRFEANGDIFVDGRLVENDRDVVDGVRKFLVGATKAAVEQANAFAAMANENAALRTRIAEIEADRSQALADIEFLREALDRIAADNGRCGEYEGNDVCDRPAVYFEKDAGAWGRNNVCCDKPEHVEAHKDEIDRARGKGSDRGVQARIDDDFAPTAIARAALASIKPPAPR